MAATPLPGNKTPSKEIMMQGMIRAVLLMLVIGLGASLVSCVEPPPLSTPPEKTLAISDFKDVAGNWQGTVRMKSRMFWYRIRIEEDGSYVADAQGELIGIHAAKDQLRLADGKLRTGTEKEYASYTLAERGGNPVLLFEARSKEGVKYRGELARKP